MGRIKLKKLLKKKDKKGVFFSLDALIALGVILIGTLIVFPMLDSAELNSFVPGDVVEALSSLKIGDLNNSVAESLISQGIITELNKTVLEAIGELYVLNKSHAINLTHSILNESASGDNFGIWFEDEMIASKNKTSYEDAKEIITERQIISGIKEGEGVTAFSVRAFLLESLQSKYFYFGGYIGEGNITARIEYDGNVSSAEMELAIAKDFDVYINENYSGSFTGSADLLTPKIYTLPIDNFTSGVNLIELRGSDLNLAGGFIKISYEKNPDYEALIKYYFPGIDGVVNIYDGFYIPELIQGMNISLHFNSTLNMFLNIGNVTVFNDSTSGVETIAINNTYLSSLLNYSQISKKTIPLRFGISDADYLINKTMAVDAVSVVDLSGSMKAGCSDTSCCPWWSCNQVKCEVTCGATWEDPLGLAKNATKSFITNILNFSSENKVGLVGYGSSFSGNDFHELSNDNTSLITEADSWTAPTFASTCICCGINAAISEINDSSTSESYKAMVVMSDGQANRDCAEQGVTGDLNGNGNPDDDGDDAIQAACDAYADHEIIVYSVGFETGGTLDTATLQAIAACGNGSYYQGDINDILDVYDDISEEILAAAYYEQTIDVNGSYSSKIFSDSYIEFDYVAPEVPFGLITTAEKMFDDAISGSFSIPPTSTILETSVISYSGSRWTDMVIANDTTIYDLESYNIDFTELGDPYSINVPNSHIKSHPENNIINLTTGFSAGNSTTGSTDNKIIYTVLQTNADAFSPVLPVSNGCNWTVEFESGTNITVEVPSDYTGTDTCFYISGVMSIANSNDAMQVAVLRLLQKLDYDDPKDGQVDTEFSEQDLQISSSVITGIPYDWATEIQIRSWV